MTEKLPNQPLTEAIFEFHWSDSSQPVEEGTQPTLIPSGQVPVSGQETDPYYRVFLRQIMSVLKEQYTQHVALPADSLPDEMAAYIVQHQFWSGVKRWPVVQVGPGIMTVNDTTNYKWETFHERVMSTLDLFWKVHPSINSVRLRKLSLKYRNMIEMDFLTQDLLQFLEQKMHTQVRFSADLFNGGEISEEPIGFGVRSSFKSFEPKGVATIAIQTGVSNGKHGLLWENNVLSSGTDVPQTLSEVDSWLSKAHDVAEHFFTSLINGDLERGFQGD